MKLLFKKIMLSTAMLLIITLSVSAADNDNFTAPNYININQSEQGSKAVDLLKKTLNSSKAFVYVSGCHLDKEALPAFQSLTGEYSDVKFIVTNQFASTKDYMLKKYGSHGAPQIFYIHRGILVSAMPYYYTQLRGKNTFLGWAGSVKKWAAALHPGVKNLDRYSNVIPVSSFNYKQVLRKKKAVLLRTDAARPEFGDDMKALLAAAAKFPDITFALDTGIVAYNQEVTTKYRKAYGSFSIIKDSDSVESSHRKPYRKKYDQVKLNAWIASNFSGEPGQPGGDMGRDGAWLKKAIQSADSYKIASMDAAEFKRINEKYNIIGKLPLQQSFYVLVNAVTDSRRNIETAKLIIKELRYDSKGGFEKAVKNKLLRQDVYVPVIQRIITYEEDGDIKKMLEELEEYYSR